MSEIPERIWDAARALRNAVLWESNSSVEHIAQALLAAEKRGKEEERNQIIVFLSERASAMAEMSMHGLPENSRVREAMEAALTQVSYIIRAAAIRGS